MLYIIGLGLGDEKDITVKGLEAVKRCDEVFLEHYTSILGVDVARLEAFYGKKVRLADRELVESGSEAILGSAKEKDVALLVVGDPFGATTHTDMFLRGREQGVEVKVIHNASIMNAVGSCGLQLYNFGQTVSIPLFQGNWKPESFYDKIACNAKDKLHTLCLLDIKVKEPNIEAMEKGKMVYDPPRYMTVKEACEQLMYVEEVRQQGLLSRETRVVGMARIGQDSQSIVAATIGDMLDGAVDMGPPLHSLVIAGDVHPLEEEMLQHYQFSPALAPKVAADPPAAAEVQAEAEAQAAALP